jgi:CRISPR-associated endonuclease/helicase Cas3
MEHLAHVSAGQDKNYRKHRLEDHLRCVGNLASEYGKPFGSQDWSYLAGLWHDLGKYCAEFQNYIKSASGFEPEAHIETVKGRVDHSTAGAQYAIKRLQPHGRILAYLIAGHHAGLPDWHKIEGGTGGALGDRLANTIHLEHTLRQTIPSGILDPARPSTRPLGGSEGFALWLRMLFSCLVDADFLDTESFMNPEQSVSRGNYTTIPELLRKFNVHMEKLVARSDHSQVNRLRAEILQECRSKATIRPGLFSLTVPTGGGKTLASMAFALNHALEYGKPRVIYAIPYTSIIEQTANIFREIFSNAVLEHHSNIDPEKESSKSRLAAENWEAPIIVTTNVQFFESLFAARTSRCRKLHNIVNSIVVLDEAQLLPPEFLEPILNVINLLSRHYGVTFVFSTATQPALNSREGFGWRFKGLDNVKEIISNPDTLFRKLERVRVKMPQDLLEPQSWDDIAQAVQVHDSVLAIVNTRNDARKLHALMPKGTRHLSALMCGEHRSRVIAEIRNKLNHGEAVRVVSTQLVEAGVDMDFPVVYRALAGLDSIAQAAGRCNREGKLVGKGRVVVFVPPSARLPEMVRKGHDTTVTLLTGQVGNLFSPQLFLRFFELFYSKTDLDKHGIAELLRPDGALQVQFRTAAKRFRLIEESDYQAVLVRYDNGENEANILLAKLEKTGPDRWLMRKLQRYTVNIPLFHFNRLLANEELREIYPGIFAQSCDTLYHPELGLLTEEINLSVESLIF